LKNERENPLFEEGVHLNNQNLNRKTVLITGGAGFIGFHLSRQLLMDGITVIAVDNLNPYYDIRLKKARLDILKEFDQFTFIEGDLSDRELVTDIFRMNRHDVVVHFAAQAGVRYSIENPDAYIQSNIVGFHNILEACRHYGTEHLVFASSSSVYGANKKVPSLWGTRLIGL
jgi:UDP-glucuronate 4-epimerase